MKKMKLVVVLAMMLTMLFGMNVCAEESPLANAELKEAFEGTATDSEGNEVNVKIESFDYNNVPEEAKTGLTNDVINQLAAPEGRSVAKIIFDIPVLKADDGSRLDHVKGSFVLTLKAPYITGDSWVKVLHFGANGWDASPKVLAVRAGEVDVEFSALSPVAVIVEKPPVTEESYDDDDDDDDDDDVVEDSRPWESPVTAGGTKSVQLGNINAGVQIGPTTKTFYERDAKILFGTDKPCSVYLMDLWLFDQNTKAHVLLEKGSGQTARITLNVPDVNPNCRVVVRHWLNGTDEYEDIIPAEIGNGYIVVDFTSLSPIAIIVEQVEATPGAAPATAAAATSGKVSPKTAEGSMIYVVEILAAVSLLGFVVYRRRMSR